MAATALNVVEYLGVQLLTQPGTGDAACGAPDQTAKDGPGQTANGCPQRTTHRTNQGTSLGPRQSPGSA
ncbi:hypothetical protein [Vreelandella piezotolerans]|uniref:hypothetical protein n=1 Tax=Vreelandella piezotolerans TaxID=2609667 RepID=UPI00129C5D77|nr:hypothetical protein [Halomonas piezotolerans]QJA23613.1 hypothetical protein GYM47_05555 [Halomonas piezotolerans]